MRIAECALRQAQGGLRLSKAGLRIDWGLGIGVALAPSAAACAAHHTGNGLVLKVDRPGAIVTISHDALPGYMEAMAMPFDLRGSARQTEVAPPSGCAPAAG